MSKKTLIKTVAIIVICIALTIVLTFAINTRFKHEEPLVYVTRTGEKYHSVDCGYLWASSIPKGKYEAIKAGYSACSRCNGKANSTIIINKYGASFAISVLIVGVLVCLGFVIYNKINTSSIEEESSNSTIPNKSSSTLNKHNATTVDNMISYYSYTAINVRDIVTHKQFGKGTVIKISKGYITVQFTNTTKVFVYPNAFLEGYLHNDKDI